jgi:hypothetical protein
MEALLVRPPSRGVGRPRRFSRAQRIAFGAYLMAFALTAGANAQVRDAEASGTSTQEQNQRRARSIRADRADWVRENKRDYAEDVDGESLLGASGDIGVLEKRIYDLSAKVRELNELLQRQRDVALPLHAQVQPMRFKLLEQHRPHVVSQTYGDALSTLVRARVRLVHAAFGNPDERKHLTIDPDAAEAERLLAPVYRWLDAPGTPGQLAQAHLRAIVYLTLLEARTAIACPEPLPAAHKLLRDLHLDRAALAEHLRRSFLVDGAPLERHLAAVLAATAATYTEPSGMRDFLKWVADGIGADLDGEFQRKAAYPYRSDAAGQFDAASENATHDNGAVLKLQITLQRMLAEARTLGATEGADVETIGAWEHRLLSAERELDLLLRAADSEREAVMTLARRVPSERQPISVERRRISAGEQAPEPLVIDTPARVADDLTTQH